MDTMEKTSSPPPAYSDPTNDVNYGYDNNKPQSYQHSYPPQPQPQPGNHYMNSNHTTVVVSQPQGLTTGQTLTHPSQVSSGMGLAIFACICCCWPIGLAAIVKASSVQDAPNVPEARARAQSSMYLSGAAIVFGIIIISTMALNYSGNL